MSSSLQIIKKISLTHWASCLSLSPKNHLLAVGSKGEACRCPTCCRTVPVMNLSEKSRETWVTNSHVVSWLPSERVLKLIKFTSGRFQDFLQHSDSLQSCRFSPSGTLLFSAAHNEVLLWEVPGLWPPRPFLNMKPCRPVVHPSINVIIFFEERFCCVLFVFSIFASRLPAACEQNSTNATFLGCHFVFDKNTVPVLFFFLMCFLYCSF